MKDTYNWGILGLGSIAHKFAAALQLTEKGKLLSVGSRELEKAEKFASQYKVERAYGNYEQLMGDPDVDIIYIATPHDSHYKYTRQCLEAGKNVLCEKPITINQKQFEELRSLAAEKKLFYMDALWTRFLPHINRTLEYIEKGELGAIKILKADFGVMPPYNPSSRLFNPELGGGTILDIGIYPVFLSYLILGYPDEVDATAIMGETGVDESCSITLRYANGAMAHLLSTFRSNTETSADISGTKGRIKLNRMFFTPTSIELHLQDQGKSIHDFTVRGNGYEYEAEEAMSCLDRGALQSDMLSHEFTSGLMKLLDEIRKEVGMLYAADKE